MSCDINAVAKQAKCFRCISPKWLRAIKTLLLCRYYTMSASSIYRGLLSQLDPGTGNPPTIITLENTFGPDLPFSYQVGGPGILLIQSNSFPQGKTLVRVSSVIDPNGGSTLVTYNNTDGLLRIFTTQAGVLGDFGYQDLSLEILVFP